MKILGKPFLIKAQSTGVFTIARNSRRFIGIGPHAPGACLPCAKDSLNDIGFRYDFAAWHTDSKIQT